MATPRGFFRRALAGMIAARERSAQRQIDVYFATHPDYAQQGRLSRK